MVSVALTNDEVKLYIHTKGDYQLCHQLNIFINENGYDVRAKSFPFE